MIVGSNGTLKFIEPWTFVDWFADVHGFFMTSFIEEAGSGRIVAATIRPDPASSIFSSIKLHAGKTQIKSLNSLSNASATSLQLLPAWVESN